MFNMINTIRALGWGGITLTAISLLIGDTHLYLISQVIASLSAFTWTMYLQNRRITPDLVISLVLSVVAAITHDPKWMYTAMLIRSVSYAMVAERLFKTDKNGGKLK